MLIKIDDILVDIVGLVRLSFLRYGIYLFSFDSLPTILVINLDEYFFKEKINK